MKISSSGWLLIVLWPLGVLAQAPDLSVPARTRATATRSVEQFGDPVALLKDSWRLDAGRDREASRSPLSLQQQRLVDLHDAGDYQSVGTEGVHLMATEPLDEALELMVANSLAWTGRIRQSIPIYQNLARGSYAHPADLGLANAQRWLGRDDLAKPLYQMVLRTDPANADAALGLDLANRALAPKTTASTGAANDSSKLKREVATLNHRWRDASGAHVFQAELSDFQDDLSSAPPAIHWQDITLRYENLNSAGKPSVEIAVPNQLNPDFFRKASVKLFDDAVTLGVGYLDWGKLATSPLATADKLTVHYAGVEAAYAFSRGHVQGRLDSFSVSDGNMIVTGNLVFNSNWRPFGKYLKPYVGAESRAASFKTTRYWSPVSGYGSIYGGLMGDWDVADWSLYGSLQLGTRLYGEAGDSWGLSAGGKYWFTRDMALGMNLWAMSSWRDNAYYKAQTLNMNMEKVWR